jgi:septum formation inhibitor-activating ATPase MinD
VIKNKNKQKWEKENVENVVVNNLNGIQCRLQENFGIFSHKMMEMTRHLEIVSVDIISIIIDNNKIVMLSFI